MLLVEAMFFVSHTKWLLLFPLAVLTTACAGESTSVPSTDLDRLRLDASLGSGESPEECLPTSDGGDAAVADDGCWVTGGGYVESTDGRDTYGGNAKAKKSGEVRGQWQHVDHGGRAMHGTASYLVCRTIDGPGPGAPRGTFNQAFFGGTTRWREAGVWSEGYWFDVVVEDRGEGKGAKSGGGDRYKLTVRKEVDVAANQAGTIVYEVEGKLGGGNVQLHASNGGHPVSVSALPPWVDASQ